MRGHSFRLGCATAALTLGFAISGNAGPAQDGRKSPTANWPMVAGDWGNGRYSGLGQITAANVKTLGGAWVHKFDGEVSRGTPVVFTKFSFTATTVKVVPRILSPTW